MIVADTCVQINQCVTSLSIYRCGRAAPRPQYLFRATAAVALVSSVVALGDRGVSTKKVSRLPRVVLFAAVSRRSRPTQLP